MKKVIKMGKTLLVLCAALAVSALTLPAEVRAAQKAVPSESVTADAYKAYYEILKAAVDRQGVAGRKPGSRGLDFGAGGDGLVCAELIDFDGDGLPALLYVCGGGGGSADRKCRIYGYSDGQARLYCDEGAPAENEDGPVRVTAYMGHGADNFHGFEIAEGKGGVKYLRVFYVWKAEQDFYYTADGNGGWVRAFTRDYSPPIFADEEFEWYVNGAPVSESDYYLAPEAVLGVTGTRRIPECPETVYGVLDALRRGKH